MENDILRKGIADTLIQEPTDLAVGQGLTLFYRLGDSLTLL